MEKCTIHCFVDASQEAYSAAVFLRVETDEVSVHLLAAKSRVTPLKKVSIPRLELLAACIGARLYDTIQRNFKNELECYFWSDSTTVLSWIRCKDEWTTFVWNRVQEIRSLTPIESWRHVPGALNPADLPSRGCSARNLSESKWWKGPPWLYETSELWPREDIVCDEEEINKERKKRLVKVTSMMNNNSDYWHLNYFSKISKTLRMMAWILRFLFNSKRPAVIRQDSLSTKEVEDAEKLIYKIVQQECFGDETCKEINSLNPFKDEDGLIRLKTRISEREDIKDFRFPIVLSAKHPVVKRMIFDLHVNSCHVGTQGLLSILRERFWIIGGRRAVRSIIRSFVTCNRYRSKQFNMESPPLPVDRVREAVAFEVVGVDFAGPLYLKNGDKVWVCLFTCAVYRAVHLEPSTSLSAHSFIQALSRFIARRGRPKAVYSDNATNFVGAENAFKRLDWDSISNFASVQRIDWHFNPPAAPWWGGFWERLIGVMKNLLRKVLGRTSLFYEDFLTILCDCEAVINSRPLTYLSSDSEDLIALSPAMFLRDQAECGTPDCDVVDQTSLSRKMIYKQKIRNTLRSRFRNEYLGQLASSTNKKKSRQITLGEIVLVGNDNHKRLDWPLARVVELIAGKDNRIRLVRVKTARGSLVRPIQKIYPLECTNESDTAEFSASTDKEEVSSQTTGRVSAGVKDIVSDIKSRVSDKVKCTRSGRQIRKPERFDP